MPVALGFIEINSLIGAVEASNVMAKTSNIILLGKEVLSPGLIAIKIIGEKESVEAAISAGAEAVRSLERNFSSHIIVDPDEQIFSVLPEIRSLFFSIKKFSKRKIKKPETEKTKIEPEKSIDKTKKVTEKSQTKAKKTKFEAEKSRVKPKNPKVKTRKPKIKIEKPKSKAGEPALQKSGAEIKETEKPKIENQEPEAENVLTNEKSVKEIEDIFIVHQPKGLRTKSLKKIVEEKITGIKESKRTSYRNDTIERLRKEALGLNKPEKKKPVKKETKKKKENKNKIKDEKNNLKSMNVHQLRSLARSTKNFPIQGREISKAKRDILLKYFNSL